MAVLVAYIGGAAKAEGGWQSQWRLDRHLNDIRTIVDIVFVNCDSCW